MKKALGKAIRATRIARQKNVKRFIRFVVRFSGTTLLLMAYNDLGILNYEDNYVSGECFLISKILKTGIKTKTPVFFDVGANTGEYSKTLREHFATAVIYAFEPNPYTFDLMKELEHLNVYCVNVGMGSVVSKAKIHIPQDNNVSEHATIYSEVLSDLHQKQENIAVDITISTIDQFCQEQKIDYIDFLKVDTEGHEYNVLSGAQQMINGAKIGVIQFEFNEMNIISRVFLKDFYDLLKDYKIYRLDSNRLIPMLKYYSVNEIFQFQNIVAISQHMKVDSNWLL